MHVCRMTFRYWKSSALRMGEIRLEVYAVVQTRRFVKGSISREIVDLGADLAYDVSLSWQACRADGSYDALFVPKRVLKTTPSAAVNWPEPNPGEFVKFGNAPGQAKLRTELVEQLLAHCRQNLPQEAVPADIALVDTIVRMPDGAVDFASIASGYKPRSSCLFFDDKEIRSCRVIK